MNESKNTKEHGEREIGFGYLTTTPAFHVEDSIRQHWVRGKPGKTNPDRKT